MNPGIFEQTSPIIKNINFYKFSKCSFITETVIATKYSIQVNQAVKIPQTLCAIVPCKFTADSREEFLNSTGYWKQGLDIVASTDMSAGTKQNFHAIGDPNNGDCTLKITNAKKEDEGTYFFRFEESKDSINKYNYLDTEVTLQVTGKCN